ncbi:4-hydroxybenzoate 3-monooxygenase [Nisaea acidiphila]|uniref:4-hydroxybenzoate 3-monooxygenase n=1 Tax=Nisaea acidiphila TaxID=1862145 RepID=A0A9J7AVG7_9PROT|nr:4-hydroxybenzoate 3-monooxygenase [Nisaea acidiphila]UUX50794.1 4-hydroxybenzoate 3-monooxygenase [Nisaea acidiphila]
MKTQVGIIGAGPAGLMLAQTLRGYGIDCVILEQRSEEYVLSRIRAGVLEHPTVEFLHEMGAGERLAKEGMPHEGIDLLFRGEKRRIDFPSLTGGKKVTVYGQQEVVKDLILLKKEFDGQILFEAEDVAIHGAESDTPSLSFTHEGQTKTLACDFIAGCDGFHGAGRKSIPEQKLRLFEKVYPFAWLGVLAEAAPAQDELIYSRHEDGFALFSMRSPEVTRLYLQCDPDENLEEWPDSRVWDELHKRLEAKDGFRVNEGTIIRKDVTPMRSFVCETMRHGRLFLAGDAAHIVPPTGAKGLNLAAGDVKLLSEGLADFYKSGSTAKLDGYEALALKRIWAAQRFSWFMTSLLHKFPDGAAFDHEIQFADLDFYTGTETGRRNVAENYVGLPFGWSGGV